VTYERRVGKYVKTVKALLINKRFGEPIIKRAEMLFVNKMALNKKGSLLCRKPLRKYNLNFSY
jgi:hypothetical protein